MKKKAIYAGTFDPLTLGHYDLIERSSNIFETLLLAVAESTVKDTMFGLAERMEMASEIFKDFDNVEVVSFNGLLINFAREQKVSILIRGLRAYSDFEYEFQMALTNRKLAPEIETLFMMPKEIYSYISSSTVREVARLGGDIEGFVPDCVIQHIAKKLKAGR